jgi:hypothetical protein
VFGNLTEIAFPFTSGALFIVAEALGVESARAVVTTNELSPDVAADPTLSHVAFSIAFLLLIWIDLYMSGVRLKSAHAT